MKRQGERTASGSGPQGIRILHAWRCGVLLVPATGDGARGLFTYLYAAPGSGALIEITRQGAAWVLRGWTGAALPELAQRYREARHHA